VLVAAIAMVCAAVAVPAAASAQIGFEFEPGKQVFGQSGPAANLAGAHPDVTIGFGLRNDPSLGLLGRPPQAPRTSTVELPEGLIGDLRALDTCPMDDIVSTEKALGVGRCPRRAAAGTIRIDAVYPIGVTLATQDRRLWRAPAKAGEVAAFGSSVLTIPIRIAVTVTPSGGYRVRAVADQLSQSAMVRGFTATLWGVPADRQGPGPECDGVLNPFSGMKTCADSQPQGSPTVNPDVSFGGPLAGAARLPFMTNPSACGASLDASIGLVPYGTVFGPISASMNAGTIHGCELQPFSGGADVTPASREAGKPSGYTVGIDVVQNNDPGGVAAAHVKDVEVTLPEGVAISPSSANGLAACSDAQFDIGGDAEVQCPAASRIGSVTIHSPVLDDSVVGDVYVGSQLSQDPLSGQMYRLFVVGRAQGVLIKVAGGVSANPATGQLTARFENNPQLPFNRIEMRLDDGQRASLANPAACGNYVTGGRLDAWSGKSFGLSAATAIDQNCGPRGFAPAFTAGVESPVAGESSPLSAVVARGDGSQQLRTLNEVKLPEGLLGHVSHVPLCSDALADRGGCPVASRIGHVQVAAGPGGSPVWVPQQGKAPASVSLAGPYKGAPYSLSVVVAAQAGPFDLGRIVVRTPLNLDRVTTQLSTHVDVSRVFDSNGRLDQVVEGAMPTIVKGIPLNVREVRVIVDRENFTVNPTSCAPKSIDATLGSDTGQTAVVGSRFQVGDCAALGFAPRLGMRLIGKRRVKTGAHPGLKAVLMQAKGQANIARARVALPKSVVLDPSNSTDPKLVCDYDKGRAGDCDAGSVIGKATARTPLLGKPLTGDVHLVQGIRFGPTGNRIRTTPSLLVKLRGEVDIDLHGRTTVKAGRLVTTFGQVPDAPVTRFDLKINGGKKGILVITRTRKAKINLCAKPNSHRAAIALNGHNGKRANYPTTVKTPCAKKKANKRANKKK
jgi:hypothetical protein